MSEPPTNIVCNGCGSKVRRYASSCSQCGRSLSSSQLRASTTRRMTPREFRSSVEEHVSRLGMKPGPLSMVALELEKTGTALCLDLKRIEKEAPDSPLESGKLQEVMAWYAAASAEINRKS